MIKKISQNLLNNRKMYLAMACLNFIALGGVLCVISNNFSTVYSTYCMAIIGILATFSGANVGSKFVQGKNNNEDNDSLNKINQK